MTPPCLDAETSLVNMCGLCPGVRRPGGALVANCTEMIALYRELAQAGARTIRHPLGAGGSARPRRRARG